MRKETDEYTFIWIIEEGRDWVCWRRIEKESWNKLVEGSCWRIDTIDEIWHIEL